MFVDMRLEAVFAEDQFKGIKVEWLFDMVFTGSVLMDNELIDPESGWKESFTDSEIKIIETSSFENLENYNFFTYFNLNGKITEAKSYLDFTAYMEDKRLGYRFFLPYEGKELYAKEVRIAIYDKTFFTDIAYVKEEPVSIFAPANNIEEWGLIEDKNAPIYYDNTAQAVARDGAEYTGQAFPVEFVIKLK